MAHPFAAPVDAPAAGAAAPWSGRYRVFVAGRECGEERWRIDPAESGWVATGEQVTQAPHPFPSHQEYRVAFDGAGRPTALEVLWTVGTRVVHARHAAEANRWRAEIAYAGSLREQQGDFPEACEIEYGSPLGMSFLFARTPDVGAEREFPVLVIGPPFMAVTPERMRVRCEERGEWEAPFGTLPARRFRVSRTAPAGDPGLGMWVDAHGIVLEAWDGSDPASTWLRLSAYQRG